VCLSSIPHGPFLHRASFVVQSHVITSLKWLDANIDGTGIAHRWFQYLLVALELRLLYGGTLPSLNVQMCMIELLRRGFGAVPCWSIPKSAEIALGSVLSERQHPRLLKRAKNSQALLGRGCT
jgi:hypothetical protein